MKGSISGPRGAVSLSRGLARGGARKSWPRVSGTGGAGGQSPAGHVRRPSVPAEPPAAGFTCLPPGPCCSPRGRAVRHPVRLRLHGGVMKRARRSFESFAALAKAGAAPGKRETGGTVSRRSRAGTTGQADVVPGAPPAMPPQHAPPDSAVRYPARRVRGGQHRALRGHCGGTGTTGGDGQVRFPALPRDRHPSSGHPLPDMPPHRRLPAREGQRCPDRALPPGPPETPGLSSSR